MGTSGGCRRETPEGMSEVSQSPLRRSLVWPTVEPPWYMPSAAAPVLGPEPTPPCADQSRIGMKRPQQTPLQSEWRRVLTTGRASDRFIGAFHRCGSPPRRGCTGWHPIPLASRPGQCLAKINKVCITSQGRRLCWVFIRTDTRPPFTAVRRSPFQDWCRELGQPSGHPTSGLDRMGIITCRRDPAGNRLCNVLTRAARVETQIRPHQSDWGRTAKIDFARGWVVSTMGHWMPLLGPLSGVRSFREL